MLDDTSKEILEFIQTCYDNRCHKDEVFEKTEEVMRELHKVKELLKGIENGNERSEALENAVLGSLQVVKEKYFEYGMLYMDTVVSK
jgi:hypothetical protein